MSITYRKRDVLDDIWDNSQKENAERFKMTIATCECGKELPTSQMWFVECCIFGGKDWWCVECYEIGLEMEKELEREMAEEDEK